jgi:NADH-quinone oxidoreductase subunit F
MVCAGTGCVSNRSFDVKKALEEEIERRDLSGEVAVVATGCNGFCAEGPIVVYYPDGIFYSHVSVEDVPELVEEHLLKGRPLERLMYTPPEQEEIVPKLSDIDFFKYQRLVALRNRGLIDPENIMEYIGRDGYAALGKVLKDMKPDDVIAEMKKSGLRGRGGGGFPTGLKWEFCRRAKGREKFLVCNADEGDPGAFMDRSIIEADPHSIIEGMAIGAYAIGARHGFVYVRAEYPLALHRLRIAMDQAREYGLLGRDILGTDFTFSLHIRRGGGAFVCGEETSLMESIMGRSGEPRPRPPFPAESGLWGEPSNINNVETWANIPPILLNGAEWFAGIGTEKSKGTKVFSLVGKINNTGLVEVPMGISMRDIVFKIGGGIPGGKKFKAVQTGGPSGGCIPESLLDLPVDFDELQKAGSIMGSGGMIVMDESTCMVDLSRYFLDFLKEESCGKCTPCREGIERMLDILTDICEGRGRPGDIERLERIAGAVKDFSLCGLGQTAPNPVLSTIRYFRHEYEAHIERKECPAVACKGLISSPCHYTCPAGVEVPSYVGHIAHGDFASALTTIRRAMPFPAVCGRVCNHPCETRCQSGDFGEPIAIRALKRAASDRGRNGRAPVHSKEALRTKKAAIIGSGPAGLTAAYFLAVRGFPVTVFESHPELGGMLRVGIPAYRLPRENLDEDIRCITDMGVEIRTNVRVGKDISFSELQKKYDAVFVATGAHKSRPLGIEGEDAHGVYRAMDFLAPANLGSPPPVGPRVAVIGGGNSALDAARVAKRLRNVKEVTIIYRRTRVEMPAYAEEVKEAEEEGIRIELLAAPVRVLAKKGKVVGLGCIRMELGEPDASGRRSPMPIDGSEFEESFDTVISAIGESPDLSFLEGVEGVSFTKWGTIKSNPDTGETGLKGVFSGGDAVTGPSTVVEAIGAGKIVAVSMAQHMLGEEIRKMWLPNRSQERVPAFLSFEEEGPGQRATETCIPVARRKGGFDEVVEVLSEEEAIREARRCLRCDM